VAAAALSARLAQRLWRVPIPFVTVTNAGNEPDAATGKGAVPYDFRIGKFEVNNHQYTAFLNAVAMDDPHKLYDTNMTTDVHGGIVRSGSPGDYAGYPGPILVLTVAGSVDRGAGNRLHPPLRLDCRHRRRCRLLASLRPAGNGRAARTFPNMVGADPADVVGVQRAVRGCCSPRTQSAPPVTQLQIMTVQTRPRR